MDAEIENYQQKRATYDALTKVFYSPRLDIFHYCGHSTITGDDIFFQLADEPFSISDISLQYPELFFLNMCESDVKVHQKIDFYGYRTLNFPIAIMHQGAKACVATLWPILDDTAARFAQNFYTQLLKGKSFGTASIDGLGEAVQVCPNL